MKRLIFSLLLILFSLGSTAQNSPLNLWGAGLDGSTYQVSALYADTVNGFLIDVAKKEDNSKLPFSINWRGGGVPPFRIDPTGNISIGAYDANGYKLAVNGNMIAESVKVKLHTSWPDYVFHKNYSLKPLAEIEKYIQTNNHLPEIPSTKEVAKEGINLGEMNAKLLQKIEELTLYLIEKDKQMADLKKNMQKLEARVESFGSK